MSKLQLKCPNCGAEIEIENTNEYGFCSICGTKINCSQTILNYSVSSDNELERDFLISNIANLRTLHYLSKNYEDNIECLDKRKKDFSEKQTPNPPEAPVYRPKSIASIIFNAIIAGFCLPVIGFFLILFSDLKENKDGKIRYEKELLEYDEKVESYKQELEYVKTANKKRYVALGNLEKAKKDLSKEKSEALKLLDECYSLNIIPSKYRNIYAITFIYDYLTTSQGTLRDALFACDLDKIQSQLDKVIQNQKTMICKLAKIEANSEKQLKQQEKMINHLEKIEKNTYDTARASEQCAQYNKIIAHNTKVMAYCSAMTYIETSDISKYDPYAPGTIKDFGLSRFRSYYKY